MDIAQTLVTCIFFTHSGAPYLFLQKAHYLLKKRIKIFGHSIKNIRCLRRLSILSKHYNPCFTCLYSVPVMNSVFPMSPGCTKDDGVMNSLFIPPLEYWCLERAGTRPPPSSASSIFVDICAHILCILCVKFGFAAEPCMIDCLRTCTTFVCKSIVECKVS